MAFEEGRFTVRVFLDCSKAVGKFRSWFDEGEAEEFVIDIGTQEGAAQSRSEFMEEDISSGQEG